MKWFGVDSDTPNDPKIRALLVQGGGADEASLVHARARMGGLFLVWCYIADHGAQPGRGVDSAGRPLRLQEMADACYFESVDALSSLLDFCASRDHIVADAWKGDGIVELPAMAKRADDYAKKLLRKSGKRANAQPVSGVSPRNSEIRGHGPDSPVGTVDPVGVVPPTVDHTVPTERTSRARALTGSGVMAGALGREHLRHIQPCIRVCVPDFLHGQFIQQLGGDRDAADTTLRAFYKGVTTAIPQNQPIGDEPTTFWRKHFAAAFPSAAPTQSGGRPPRGASHTPAADDKYAGIGVRDTDVE